WNLENRFTGWVDVGLSAKGVDEAHAAGRLLKAEGFRFDRVFTSLLTRAILTAQIVLEELDQLWLPVERSWRLNERHYGALTGLNKKETAQKYGDAQLHQWRRGYAVLPPPLDEGDPRHPRFDARYGARQQPAPAREASRCHLRRRHRGSQHPDGDPARLHTRHGVPPRVEPISRRSRGREEGGRR